MTGKSSLVTTCVLCTTTAATFGAEPAPEPSETRRISLSLAYHIPATHDKTLVNIVCVLPQTIKGRQEIKSIRYSHQPKCVFEKNDNRYAKFAITGTSKAIELTIDIEADLFRYDLMVASRSGRPAKKEDPHKLSRYVAPEPQLESDHPLIRSAARTTRAGKERDTIHRTFQLVLKRLRYTGYRPYRRGALAAYQTGEGDCTDYSDLMIALCRANDIPARSIKGLIIRPGLSLQDARHDWVEVYMKEYGWVPFDPLHAEKGPDTFDHLTPLRLQFSNMRYDRVIGGWYLYRCTFLGKPLPVKQTIRIHPPPPSDKRRGLQRRQARQDRLR